MHGPLAEAGVNEGSFGIMRGLHSNDLDGSVAKPRQKDGFAEFDCCSRQYRGGCLANVYIRLAEEGHPLQTVADKVTGTTLRHL